MKKAFYTLVVVGLAVGIALLYISRPQPIYPSAIPAHTPSVENGELLFTAGGCLSCHLPPKEDAAADKSLPSGGHPLPTPIGTFYPPNLTPDEATGIGRWRVFEFVSAMKRGVSPGKQHYLPAFPYTSYARMSVTDHMDLFAYLKTLKPVKSPPRDPDIPVAFLLRLGIGVWKLLALDTSDIEPVDGRSEAWNRGRYLVNGPGHCGECHTPRNILMMSDTSRFLKGGPHPEGGKDKVPSLIGLIERKRYKDTKDLSTALQFGETFGYEDLSSGGMAKVQTNLSKIPPKDVDAIAEYLTSFK